MSDSSISARHASHWNAKYENAVKSSWTENRLVQHAVNARMTGNSSMHWLNWFFSEYLTDRPSRVLSIGCGDGDHELIIARNGYADYVFGFDGSPSGIALAKEKAEREGLNVDFAVMLFEEFAANYAADPFDLALFSGSMHHIRQLEDVLFAVQKAVKPGGLILVNEYVGPVYNLYPQHQLDLINGLLGIISPELRVSPDFRVVTPTIQTIYATDPSEAVRAPLIPVLVPRFFRPIFERKMKGGLLHAIFDGLDGERINDGSTFSDEVVVSLINLEDLLTASGFLANDFLFGLYCNDLANF